jgi:iron complex outermembrane receptor protein
VVTARITPNVLSYVSYSKGFKSGGFNAFGTSPAFSPETLAAVEVGLKSSMREARLLIETALFQYDYSNLQVRVPVPTGGVDIQNAAAARIRGAELQAAFRPVDALVLQASVAWLDARFTRGTLPVVPNQFVFGPPTVLGTESLTDRELSRAPDWQAGVAAEYTHRLGGLGRLGGGARYRYQDDVHFLETAQFGATFRGESWSELDLHVGFTSESERWEVSIVGQNVLDDRHIAQVAAFGGLPVASLNQPETWALQVRLSL